MKSAGDLEKPPHAVVDAGLPDRTRTHVPPQFGKADFGMRKPSLGNFPQGGGKGSESHGPLDGANRLDLAQARFDRLGDVCRFSVHEAVDLAFELLERPGILELENPVRGFDDAKKFDDFLYVLQVEDGTPAAGDLLEVQGKGAADFPKDLGCLLRRDDELQVVGVRLRIAHRSAGEKGSAEEGASASEGAMSTQKPSREDRGRKFSRESDFRTLRLRRQGKQTEHVGVAQAQEVAATLSQAPPRLDDEPRGDAKPAQAVVHCTGNGGVFREEDEPIAFPHRREKKEPENFPQRTVGAEGTCAVYELSLDDLRKRRAQFSHPPTGSPKSPSNASPTFSPSWR